MIFQFFKYWKKLLRHFQLISPKYLSLRGSSPHGALEILWVIKKFDKYWKRKFEKLIKFRPENLFVKWKIYSLRKKKKKCFWRRKEEGGGLIVIYDLPFVERMRSWPRVGASWLTPAARQHCTIDSVGSTWFALLLFTLFATFIPILSIYYIFTPLTQLSFFFFFFFPPFYDWLPKNINPE